VTEVLTGMREMTYVDVYSATRAIMRLMSGGKVTARFHDLVGDPVFELAVAVLREAIRSPDVKITVAAGGGRRPIADDERGYQLEFWKGELVDNFLTTRQPPLLNLLICADDLERFVVPKGEPAGQVVAAQADEPVRFPGRPSVGRQILAKMRERFTLGAASGTVAAEARWLMRWAQDEYPKDTSVPRKPTSVENTIRKEFHRLNGERAIVAK
jgi:hypothetical protein